MGTRDSLLSSEEFGVGGESYGRAYDSSEITGDRGWAGMLKVAYTPEQFDKNLFFKDDCAEIKKRYSKGKKVKCGIDLPHLSGPT